MNFAVRIIAFKILPVYFFMTIDRTDETCLIKINNFLSLFIKVFILIHIASYNYLSHSYCRYVINISLLKPNKFLMINGIIL